MIRRRSIASILFAAVLAGSGLTYANAAAGDPALSLTAMDRLIIGSAKSFPGSSELLFEAVVTGGNGSAKVQTSSSGRAIVAFEVPDAYSGALKVTATAGSVSKTASITIGNNTPTTSSTAATLTTVAVTTPTNPSVPSTVATTQTTSATTPTTPGASPTSGPMGPEGNWTLKFSDEFNGATLDTQKWITCYPNKGPEGCDHSNGEQQWYQPANVAVSDGALRLTGKKEASHGYPYTSGMVTTGGPGQFTYQYGYFESRFKVPKGQGYWPALWTLPADGGWPPEIDLMEILGHKTNEVHMTLHWGGDGKARGGSGEAKTGIDFASGWHTMGVDWQKDSITWYIDGVKARSVYSDTANIPHEPMYLLANLAIGGTWPGNPDASTQFPQTFDVDYIRVWQK